MKSDIRLVCFDLNKTLISENTWFNLNLAMGVTEQEDKEMFDLYREGKLSYVDWQKQLEKIYIRRGKATKENILKIIQQYTYVEGAQEVVAYLREQDYILSLISGSIDILVERVASELNIPHYSANHSLTFDENDYLSAIVCLGDDSPVKQDQLTTLSQNTHIPLRQIACVGDGDNDLGIFKLTSHGITFKDSNIRHQAWKVIGALDDLKEIL